MPWLLAGFCGLALIYISVPPNHCMRISQSPRFYGLMPGHTVTISCFPKPPAPIVSVDWYKATTYDAIPQLIQEKERYEITKINTTSSFLRIFNVKTEDSGVYFCKINEEWGPGTELQVVRRLNRKKALHRTKMKDGLIILQGLLLAVCIAALLLRKRKLFEKKDSIYEEPETDHIYEGLAIETCGGGLYEELSVYAQADGAEAPWE
ncbi:B-cell antigen receptor complex-associated protein beta chain isoform X2 [Micropterus dolomieu]|uniref:B-cell antigen receptor complex-associated protein beta chain isoform X2 n=1 Tax=Micropterus dolomieu TaxID=147949 RepID=UPI001E8CD599|nr:B-cell antigen receptor complex-associated protein beta chain isoform X2 [Micropterus dolomieu]